MQPSSLIRAYVLHRDGTPPYSADMYMLHLSDRELETARHALRAYLSDFGHDEADTIEEIRRVIAKLDAAQTDGQDPRISA